MLKKIASSTLKKKSKLLRKQQKSIPEKADFYLKENTSEFDRLYAQGKVTINHEQKKRIRNAATFYAKDGKLVLEGNPKLQETGKGRYCWSRVDPVFSG